MRCRVTAFGRAGFKTTGLRVPRVGADVCIFRFKKCSWTLFFLHPRAFKSALDFLLLYRRDTKSKILYVFAIRHCRRRHYVLWSVHPERSFVRSFIRPFLHSSDQILLSWTPWTVLIKPTCSMINPLLMTWLDWGGQGQGHSSCRGGKTSTSMLGHQSPSSSLYLCDSTDRCCKSAWGSYQKVFN